MYCFAYFMVTKYIYKVKIDTVLFIFFSRKIESTTLLIFFLFHNEIWGRSGYILIRAILVFIFFIFVLYLCLFFFCLL